MFSIPYFNSSLDVDEYYIHSNGLLSPTVYEWNGQLYLDAHQLEGLAKKRLGNDVPLSYAFKYDTALHDLQIYEDVNQFENWKTIERRNGIWVVTEEQDAPFTLPFNIERVEEWWSKWRSKLHNLPNCCYDLTAGKDTRLLTSFYFDNDVDTTVFVRYLKRPIYPLTKYDREISHLLVDRMHNPNIQFGPRGRKLLIEGYGTEPFRHQENNVGYLRYLTTFHRAWKSRKINPFVDDLLLSMNWEGHGEEAHDYLLKKYCKNLLDIDFHSLDRQDVRYRLH